MEILLKSFGSLRDYLGSSVHVVELRQEATLRDLLLEIERRWGSTMPAYLWNNKKHQFRGAIVIMINKRAQNDLSIILRDQDEVYLFHAMVGG